MLFLPLFEQFIAFYQNPKCEDHKHPGTIENYWKRYRKIAAWLRTEQLSHIEAEQFTISIAKRLFRAQLEKHSRNHAVRIARQVVQVLAWAVDEEIIKHNPLHQFRLKKEHKKKIIHLTPEELLEIERWQFFSPYLTRVRDLFLWSCYTGMDYGDTMAVNKSHMFTNPKDQRVYIIKPRNKRGEAALIPYFEKTRRLWEKYNHQLPRMANCTYNRILKEIFFIVGFNKRISTHTGRKTFAMIKLNNEGYSLPAVSAMLGHKSIRTTEEYYAKVNIDVVSNELRRINAA